MPEAYAASIERLRSMAGTPRDPDGHVFAVIAEYLRRDGKLDEAKEVVERGIAMAPDFASGHVVAAHVLVELGDLEGAKDALERLSELDRDNTRASELHRAVKDAEEAAALDWARAQGLGPPVEVDDEVVTVTLGELYLEQGAADRAEQVALHLLQEDADHVGARALLERAQAQSSAGVLTDALAATPAVGDLAPDATDIAELAPDPVAIGTLAPDAVPVESLAPTVVPVAELAPDGVPVGMLAPDPIPHPVAPPAADQEPEDMSDFMFWLDEH